MLKELKFVQGAVAKKDFLPAMTHFAIQEGRVRAYNGMIALSSPLPFNIDCVPKAEPLVKAISNCHETITLSMTPAGKLRVQSGKFRAFIECIDEPTAHVEPEGEVVNLNGELVLDAMRRLFPFIGDDASRPWSNGILLKGQSAFATNNVILIENWLGDTFPFTANIPRAAVKEMLRINEAPEYAQMTETSMTFHYKDGRWVRTQLLSLDWPNVEQMLNCSAELVPIELEMYEALEALKPFADKLGRVYIKGNNLSTTEQADEEGASYTIPNLSMQGVYRIEMLSLLKGVAIKADFTRYPQPCPFMGDKVRGLIIGMKF